MNWDQVEVRWTQMRGSVKQKWPRLTDDDLDYIAGCREQFIVKFQERYGIGRKEAEMRAEDWLKNVGDAVVSSEARKHRAVHHSGSAT